MKNFRIIGMGGSVLGFKAIHSFLFEKIKISRVDMFVTQSNVAYPVVVPNFPSYTDDSYLNYGSKLN